MAGKHRPAQQPQQNAGKPLHWRQRRRDALREEIIVRLRSLPGGKRLLKLAQDHGVTIDVVRKRDIDGAKGRFSRRRKGQRVRISDINDPVLMTATLWHELRHVQQHILRGDLQGGTTRLIDTRMQHTLSLMHEADAFTVQFLMALREADRGNPDYLEKLQKRDSAACVTAAKFLKRKPYHSFRSDAQFARALFTEIMLEGLTGYNAKYFKNYRDTLKSLETVVAYRGFLKRHRAAPDFNVASAPLAKSYGRKLTGESSIMHVARAFLAAQPENVYSALEKIERMAQDAPALTEQQYQQGRQDIVELSGKLSRAFKKAALPPRQDVGQRLRHVALKGLKLT